MASVSTTLVVCHTYPLSESKVMFRFFENLIDPLHEHEVVRPPQTAPGFIFHYLHPVRKILIITLLLSGISAITDLLLYTFVADMIDWMSNTPPEDFFTEHGAALWGMFFVVAVIRPVSVISSRALINLAIMPGVANTVRWQNHRYVLRQSLRYFYGDFAGRISQKVMQTGYALREMLLNLLDGIWFLFIYLVGVIAFFTQISWQLLLPVSVWVIGYILVVLFMVPPVRTRSAQVSEANSGLTGRLVDSYSNILSVKLFAHSSREEQFAAEGVDTLHRAMQFLMRSIIKMTATLSILNTLLIISTAVMSIVMWRAGQITVGEIAMVNGLIIRLNQMSGWILRTITALFESIGTLQNGIETISMPNELQDAHGAGELTVPEGEVVFDKVSFGYHDQHISVIEGIDLTIRPGEKVGLVGRSGAGKSTLVNLLLRLYDIDKGAIRIDGQNISHVKQEDLRQHIAMVTQDTSLLHRSIRENIRYGRYDATDEEVMVAARLAEADDFIGSLVDQQGRRGFDAMVGERGVKLSGGQRQRIAIARVILKNAPILVLDEATSALDSEVEAAIQGQLENLMHGKTVIAIAHRLSTIAALDTLIVIDDGKIVEQGPHSELIENNGLYAKLWARQSGGFLGVEA